ncbi:hypothetical protein L226DRAFT_477730 [Lentinus tigrinus ALCF2SS1-7]|uniref:DUF676 domain-containing protein n=1 Tax=Lentinus tigrinus ALCF2SS1-6 TaxID=1328759 RepID=A0A5C2SUM7_9APHY|nr:hypothetical protein L227DRAFT_569485 [Lentinus tigrinus ALCF2SS1-6]RPD81280.1 hypothetical protein L226DRAFT_477730 [Lentinus tigrinus ALCF2SS1-7]
MATTNLAAHNPADAATDQTIPADLVLLIFIHGFKGDDSTFGEFPQRLAHILSESLPNTTVESVVFPAYETKGELNAAVVRFADWLTDLTVRKEVANGGAGRAKIVLCGHSMGGLLAADALIEFVRTRPDQNAPLWPNIVACLAYDTPYLGLHPHVFKNSATQAAEYVRTATNVLNSFKSWRAKTPSGAAAAAAASNAPPPVPPKAAIAPPPAAEPSAGTSLWQKWAAPAAYTLGGALFAGAAAGAAYYKREDIGVGATWVTDHLKYVGNLWNKDELDARLDRILQIESRYGVLFQTFFSCIPASPPDFPRSRTFAVLPHPNTPLGWHYAPNHNSLAADEIQAHTGMFDGKRNDGYYDLGLSSAKLIREAVLRHRTEQAGSHQPPATVKQADEVKDAVYSSATVEAARAAEAAVPVSSAAAAAPPPVEAVVPAGAVEQTEESEEEDGDEEEEEEKEAKPAPAAQRKDAKPAEAKEEDESEEEEDDDDDDDDDEEEDDDEDEDDDDDDDEEEDDDDDEEEDEETKPPTKKA